MATDNRTNDGKGETCATCPCLRAHGCTTTRDPLLVAFLKSVFLGVVWGDTLVILTFCGSPPPLLNLRNDDFRAFVAIPIVLNGNRRKTVKALAALATRFGFVVHDASNA